LVIRYGKRAILHGQDSSEGGVDVVPILLHADRQADLSCSSGPGISRRIVKQ
jgi:hypothetical protein